MHFVFGPQENLNLPHFRYLTVLWYPTRQLRPRETSLEFIALPEMVLRKTMECLLVGVHEIYYPTTRCKDRFNKKGVG